MNEATTLTISQTIHKEPRKAKKSSRLQLTPSVPCEPCQLVYALYGPSQPGKLYIFNPQGSLVQRIVVDQTTANLQWNGTDFEGSLVPPGCYLCVLSIGKFSIDRKLIIK